MGIHCLHLHLRCILNGIEAWAALYCIETTSAPLESPFATKLVCILLQCMTTCCQISGHFHLFRLLNGLRQIGWTGYGYQFRDSHMQSPDKLGFCPILIEQMRGACPIRPSNLSGICSHNLLFALAGCHVMRPWLDPPVVELPNRFSSRYSKFLESLQDVDHNVLVARQPTSLQQPHEGA